MTSIKINNDNTISKNYVMFRIFQYNPHTDNSANYIDYKTTYEKWTTVLDCLLQIKNNMNHSIAMRYSCRQASCGSCGMIINGKPRLACFTKISEINSDTIQVEPMNNFPIIRDLVVDFKKMFDQHKKIKPHIIRNDSEISYHDNNTKEFLQTRQELEKYLQFSNCIKCGLCNSVCPTMATDSSFIGPQALTQAYRYVADNRDKGTKTRLKIIDDSHGIWRCHSTGSCSKVCPKGIDPAMGIQLLRRYLLGFHD